jgi:lipopolysaccharide/colanic/teichoic acid biosynthesis glycosyltransferase
MELGRIQSAAADRDNAAPATERRELRGHEAVRAGVVRYGASRRNGIGHRRPHRHAAGRHGAERGMMARDRVAKRVMDVVLASLALVVLAPVLLLIAALVRLEDRSAPVVFRQRRCGYAGHEFELLKFRTMVRGADRLKEQLRSQSTVPWPDFRLPDDPRVTRVGRVLRRTSADELPQLINVLRGDMSLVGPRPTSFKRDTYALWQTERLEFRPGITGPWQVWGRDTMDFDERCRLEIRFFREATLWRELRLLAATCMTVLRRTGVA